MRNFYNMKKNYRVNEVIFQEGDLSEAAYIIKSGKVEILQDYPENPISLAILKKGDVFGEMGLLEERQRSLTARALSKTQISIITRQDFVNLIQNNSDEAFRYLQMIFGRLQTMNVKLNEQIRENQQLSLQLQALKQTVEPRKEFQVKIFPLTQVTKNYLPEDGYLINKHVFRVGRQANQFEDTFEMNDLAFRDKPPYHISRNHFSIEKTPDGVIANDRGSSLGTIVNGQSIGGLHRGAICPLIEGENNIIAGSQFSPFKFSVMVRSELN